MMMKIPAMNAERLIRKAGQYSIQIKPEQADKLELYEQLLLEWNQKMNLTAITDSEAIEEKHFLDSLFLVGYEEVQGKVADVGTGAGFPGVVLKLFKPEIDLTLIEPNGKRVLFLHTLCSELGIKATILNERAEDLANGRCREQFNCVTARAVAALPALCEYCLPLVTINGYFLPLKGDSDQEIMESENAIKLLGGAVLDTYKYRLTDESNRSIIKIKKLSKTPDKYPRNNAQIKKKPLV